MIRDATPEDADYFVSAAVDYFRETDERHYLTLDPDAFRAWWLDALERGLIALVDDRHRGHICGVEVPSMWNPRESVARVITLWVVPEHRGTALAVRLLRAFEERVTAQAVMVDTNEAFAPERVGRMYERRGYRPVSRFYVKENTWAQQRQS